MKRLWVLLFAACSIMGCAETASRPHAVPVYPVEGRLFVGGTPAAGAVVSFHQRETGTIVSTNVHTDGRFVPSQSDGAVGLAEGSYSLTATWPDGQNNRLANKHADPANPLAEINVARGLNLIPPIHLP